MKTLRHSTGSVAFALLALVLQFTFGFGHVHDRQGHLHNQKVLADSLSVAHVGSLDDHALQDHAPNTPDPGHDNNEHVEHGCLACKTISKLVSLVPEGVVGIAPVVSVSARKIMPVVAARFSSIAGRNYRARAPPSQHSLSL